jgi:hypothetical protein
MDVARSIKAFAKPMETYNQRILAFYEENAPNLPNEDRYESMRY